MNIQKKYQVDFIAYCAISRLGIHRFMRVWTQTLVPPAITMTLYFIIFGRFVGAHIPDIEGYNYMQFIMSGLIMMSIILNAFNNAAFSFFIEKLHKSNQNYAVAPISNLSIIMGFVTAAMARSLIVGVIVSVISLFFTHISPYSFTIILCSGILSSMFFSLAGFANGIMARTFDDVNAIPTFLLTPLIYLGGVFYSIHQLPPLWQKVSLANPVMYIIETFRYGFLGFADINIVFGFVMLIVFNIALIALNLWLLNQGRGLRTE